MRLLVPLLLLPLAAATGCSQAPDPPAGLTQDDQRQLNEAAEMLDANSVDLNAVSANESTAL